MQISFVAEIFSKYVDNNLLFICHADHSMWRGEDCKVSYVEAERKCSEIGAHLVEFRDEEEWQKVSVGTSSSCTAVGGVQHLNIFKSHCMCILYSCTDNQMGSRA